MNEPAFPPLMSGHPVDPGIDPFDKACAMAALGCDAGLIVHNIAANRLAAALVMAPEVPLEQAMAMLPACALGFQNALGALAPPEVAVHLEWAGGLRVNGAACGRLRVMAGHARPDELPGWLVVGLELPLLAAGVREGGTRPDATALYDEGCADVDATRLLEAWARHTLNWITRWEDEGPRAVHAQWRALAEGIGGPVTRDDLKGTFLGIDENFGMLLRDEAGKTHLLALSTILEQDG